MLFLSVPAIVLKKIEEVLINEKMFALLLALAMTLSLAACGGSSSSSTEDSTSSAAAEDTSAAVTDETADDAVEADVSGETYTVGIVNWVDDASLNQIVENIQTELEAKGEELGCTFEVNYDNAQADATVLNQIGADMVASQVDVIVAVATPVATVMQATTEDTDIPVVFSAVSDPVGAGLVESMEEPGGNVTGTSDALDTTAIMNLMLAADPDLELVGLLYDTAQDSSTQPIEDAKA
ncbi:MAG: ABC transporter, partial [Clostridiales bacterium]|nr:ABC transporter [Clostridiales bacterium]